MYLCLSLGHNSSAVMLFENGDNPIGYEEERLSKKKSDSAFPILSITRILEILGPDAANEVKDVYISHWFDTLDPYTAENKYYSASKLKALFPNASLAGTDIKSFSHHDAHAESVAAFFSYHNKLFDDRPKVSYAVFLDPFKLFIVD